MDDNGKSLIQYIIESFDSNETRFVDQIKEIFQVNDSIRRLLAFKILKKIIQ